MQYKRFEDMIVVRLETGEDMHGSVRDICEREHIMMGTVTGFGGVSRLKLGIWNQLKNDYDTLLVENRDMELLNVTGNLSMLDGKAHTHFHVTASDSEFHVFGGHLIEGTVNNLMELMLQAGPGRIDRIPVGNWFFMDLKTGTKDRPNCSCVEMGM